jgi:hypothetical protein
MLAHVWNEVEHDLVYKGLMGEPSQDERDFLVSLGHLVRSGDTQLRQLLLATERRLAQVQGIFRNQWDFIARVQGNFPDADDFGTYSGQLYAELIASGLNTPQRIQEALLQDPNYRGRAATLITAINDYLDQIQDEVARFEPGTADELGVLFLFEHHDAVMGRHPGQGRPLRIASLARRIRQYKEQLGAQPAARAG